MRPADLFHVIQGIFYTPMTELSYLKTLRQALLKSEIPSAPTPKISQSKTKFTRIIRTSNATLALQFRR